MCMLIRVPDYNLQVWDIDQSCLVYQSAILSGTSHLSVLKTFDAPINFLALLISFFILKVFAPEDILGCNFDCVLYTWLVVPIIIPFFKIHVHVSCFQVDPSKRLSAHPFISLAIDPVQDQMAIGSANGKVVVLN